MRLVLLDYRLFGILTTHEGTRCTVHISHRCFPPYQLMDKASALVSAAYSVRRVHLERIPNHDRISRPSCSPDGQPPRIYRNGPGAGTLAPGSRANLRSQNNAVLPR